MTDDITMKGKRIMISCLLQRQILQQLLSNHMSIGEMRFLVHESIYWVNKKADIKNTAKQCAISLHY